MGGGILENNLYAYCLNDPVNMVDYDGRAAVMVTIAFGAMVIGTFGVILTINSPGYRRSRNELAKALSKGISIGLENIKGFAKRTISSISGKVKEITKSVLNSFARAKTKPKYKTEREWHHIVAKKAKNAGRAKKCLKDAGYEINDSINLIYIKTGLHRRIHTNLYYGWANSILISAFNAAGDNEAKQRSNVRNALNTLRNFLSNLDKIAPF